MLGAHIKGAIALRDNPFYSFYPKIINKIANTITSKKLPMPLTILFFTNAMLIFIPTYSMFLILTIYYMQDWHALKLIL